MDIELSEGRAALTEEFIERNFKALNEAKTREERRGLFCQMLSNLAETLKSAKLGGRLPTISQNTDAAWVPQARGFAVELHLVIPGGSGAAIDFLLVSKDLSELESTVIQYEMAFDKNFSAGEPVELSGESLSQVTFPEGLKTTLLFANEEENLAFAKAYSEHRQEEWPLYFPESQMKDIASSLSSTSGMEIA